MLLRWFNKAGPGLLSPACRFPLVCYPLSAGFLLYTPASPKWQQLPLIFCVMRAGQHNMLCDGREQVPEHPDPEGGITGHYIFDLVRILVELQMDVAYGVVVTGQLYPFLHAKDEAGPQCFLIGGA